MYICKNIYDMKRPVLAAVSVLAAIACTETGPEITPQPQEGETITVSATSAAFVESRTSLDGTSVLWGEGDRIKLFSNNGSDATFALTAGAETADASFTGTVPGTPAPYYGFYPADNAVSLSGNAVNYILPKVQSGTAYSFAQATNPAIAQFSSLGTKAVFYNMQGLMKLTLRGTQTISELKITSLADEMLWGSVAAAVDASRTPDQWSQTISGGDNVISLQFTGGLRLTPGGTDVYFVLPTGTLSKGFKLVIYDMVGTAADEFLSTEDHTIRKGAILPVTRIDTGVYNLLDADGSANCYNIARSNSARPFKFCTVKGNGLDAVKAASVEEYWETLSTSSSAFNGGNLGFLLTDISLNNNCVTFKIKGTAGSALLAVRDASGDVLWSWHIWITNKLPGASKMTNGVTVMDLNLGAGNAGTINAQLMGFLYQWGRKDPFPAPYHVAYSSLMKFNPEGVVRNEVKPDADLDYVIRNPSTFIDNNSARWDAGGTSVWAEQKTIYDPCPPGYRVPTSAELSGLSFGEWDATYCRYTELGCGYFFPVTSRIYYSSGGAHTTETANTGYYWTCTHSNGNLARMATVSSDKKAVQGDINKSFGLAVRCVAESTAVPTPPATPVKVSIIGDSISTFKDYITSGNACYYPRTSEIQTADLEVVSVDQTYWHQLIYKYMPNAVLEKNDAWSGSCVGGYDNTCMVKRFSTERMGNPDLIILHAGQNDLSRNVGTDAPSHYLVPGVFVSEDDDEHPTKAEMNAIFEKDASDWNQLSETMFIESYVKLLHKIRVTYPATEVLIIIGDRLAPSQERAILAISDKYGLHCVDFLALGRDCLEKVAYVHPSIKGMAAMSKYIWDKQGAWLSSL